MRRHLPIVAVLLLLAVAAGMVAVVAWRGGFAGGAGRVGEAAEAVATVEVALVERGTVRGVRFLTGTVEASARFVVGAKVRGLLRRVSLDIGDQVEREQVVAEIDDAEFVQAVAQAQADLAVRSAELIRARSDLDLARREFERSEQLRARGIAAEAALDEVAARLQSTTAAVTLAEAQVSRAEAALELARIELGYTLVRASWSDGAEEGVIAERFQDAGNSVQPGDGIVSVVKLNPLKVVIFVTERDYAGLSIGQRATVTTDAVPGREFEAAVERVAPQFREASRQARVELVVDNPDLALRPGLFVRVRIVMREVDDAIHVPLAAVARRDGRPVVFLVSEETTSVRMVPVTTGIEDGDRLQIIDPPLAGRVVTLGHQLLSDGTRIRVPAHQPALTDAPASPGGVAP